MSARRTKSPAAECGVPAPPASNGASNVASFAFSMPGISPRAIAAAAAAARAWRSLAVTGDFPHRSESRWVMLGASGESGSQASLSSAPRRRLRRTRKTATPSAMATASAAAPSMMETTVTWVVPGGLGLQGHWVMQCSRDRKPRLEFVLLKLTLKREHWFAPPKGLSQCQCSECTTIGAVHSAVQSDLVRNVLLIGGARYHASVPWTPLHWVQLRLVRLLVGCVPSRQRTDVFQHGDNGTVEFEWQQSGSLVGMVCPPDFRPTHCAKLCVMLHAQNCCNMGLGATQSFSQVAFEIYSPVPGGGQ